MLKLRLGCGYRLADHGGMRTIQVITKLNPNIPRTSLVRVYRVLYPDMILLSGLNVDIPMGPSFNLTVSPIMSVYDWSALPVSKRNILADLLLTSVHEIEKTCHTLKRV